MRYLIGCVLFVAMAAGVLGSAQATTADLTQWFSSATASETPGTSKDISTPDYLGGKTAGVALLGQARCKFKFAYEGLPWAGPWLVLRYDHKHHIGLAMLHDDSDGCAVFEAPAPARPVPDADLSQASTARGLHIGSPYSQVLSLYGPPVKSGRRFVTSYSTTIPAPELNPTTRYRTVKLPERITLVIDDGHVSSILIDINESGLV